MLHQEIPRILLTVNEVATFYRVSRAAVYGWIRQGKLKATTNPGGSIRIRVSDLSTHLSQEDLRLDA